MVDAHGLGPCFNRSGGSTPLLGTKITTMKYKLILITLALISSVFVNNAYAQNAFDSSPVIKNGDAIVIKSPINSDVYLFGNTIDINDQIDGDVFAFAKDVNVNSKINGDLRSVSLNLNIKSVIDGSVSFISDNVYISSLGEINKDVYGYTNTFNLEGRIGKNLNLVLTQADINIKGKIIGDFYYSESRPNIDSKANIEGQSYKVSYPLTTVEDPKDYKMFIILSKIMHTLIIASLSMLILKTKRNWFEKSIKNIGGSFLKLFSFGLLFLMLISVASFILIFTFFGAPLGFFAGLFILFFSYISPAFVGPFIGYKLFPQKGINFLTVTLGILIYDIITLVPVANYILQIVSVAVLSGIIYCTYFNINLKNE